MKRSGYTYLLMLLFLCSCGGVSDDTLYDDTVVTQAPPYVNRVDPKSGKAGDTVSLYGFGFSAAAGNNVIAIGPLVTVADTYGLVADPTGYEIEVLTTTVPDGSTGADLSVWVDVFDNISNTNVTFTVNP